MQTMDDSSLIEFPPEVRALLDQAVLALWDPARPDPDLNSITDWLEVEGWDYVVDGLVGAYRYVGSRTGPNYLGQIVDYLNDDYLLECTDIDNYSRIKNADRIEFARSVIASSLEESMDSIHSIPVLSDTMPPADLCMMMYFHPQGGAEFSNLFVCHSIDDYLEPLKGDIAMDANSLSDRDILKLWRKGKFNWVKSRKS
jgi:hypothetical protein